MIEIIVTVYFIGIIKAVWEITIYLNLKQEKRKYLNILFLCSPTRFCPMILRLNPILTTILFYRHLIKFFKYQTEFKKDLSS